MDATSLQEWRRSLLLSGGREVDRLITYDEGYIKEFFSCDYYLRQFISRDPSIQTFGTDPRNSIADTERLRSRIEGESRRRDQTLDKT